MEASQSLVEVMASRCVPQTARGRHAFQIVDYSLQKCLGAGKFVQSAKFAVGGHDWRIWYYPGGDGREGSKDSVTAYLELISKAAEVRVLYEFRVVNLETMLCSVAMCGKRRAVFSALEPARGYSQLMKKSELEALPFLRDDQVVLVCDVTVLMGTTVSEHKTNTTCGFQVPPSDLVDDLGKLLESEEGVDVTFKVEDQIFHAHKIVLAMRSPVFKAELYGPMREQRQQRITVKDMQPAVFKALLHFIYKDSIPEMDDLDENDNEEMVKHLLVAADRYAMERMKLMRENILCKRLDEKSVATT